MKKKTQTGAQTSLQLPLSVAAGAAGAGTPLASLAKPLAQGPRSLRRAAA